MLYRRRTRSPNSAAVILPGRSHGLIGTGGGGAAALQLGVAASCPDIPEASPSALGRLDKLHLIWWSLTRTVDNARHCRKLTVKQHGSPPLMYDHHVSLVTVIDGVPPARQEIPPGDWTQAGGAPPSPSRGSGQLCGSGHWSSVRPVSGPARHPLVSQRRTHWRAVRGGLQMGCPTRSTKSVVTAVERSIGWKPRPSRPGTAAAKSPGGTTSSGP